MFQSKLIKKLYENFLKSKGTGKAGAIQVTQETRQILEQFGYTFIERGLVMVKGKGELLTFYLQGKTAVLPSLSAPPTTIETEPNETQLSINENQQTLVKNISTDSPAHLTSVSSSTASPNSVRLNQEFIDKQNNSAANATVLDCELDIETTQNKVVNNTNNLGVSSTDDVDAHTPLLSSHQNNNNNTVDSNHFSIDEKDALLDNAD